MDNDNNYEINKLREAIDRCDNEIFDSLRNRFVLVHRLGKIKKKLGLPIVDNNRYEEMVNDKIIRLESIFLTKPFIKKLYKVIHGQSCKIQKSK